MKKVRVWRRLRVESQSRRNGAFLAGVAVDETLCRNQRVIPVIAPLDGADVPEGAEAVTTEDDSLAWYRAGLNCSAFDRAEQVAAARSKELIRAQAYRAIASERARHEIKSLQKEGDALDDYVKTLVVGGV